MTICLILNVGQRIIDLMIIISTFSHITIPCIQINVINEVLEQNCYSFLLLCSHFIPYKTIFVNVYYQEIL